MNPETYIPNSKFGWVDFNPKHKDTFDEMLRALQGPGVVDELGVGVVRDSFSDKLFPGTSTIMTRAKYYLLTPYIFRNYLREDIKDHPNPRVYLEKAENNIIEQLYQQMVEADKNAELSEGEKKERTQGILGSNTQRRGEELERKPSAIYWNGMRVWGIINTELSLSNLLSTISKSRKELITQMEDSESLFASNTQFSGKLLQLNELGTNWEEDFKITLEEREADYLRNKILERLKGSMLHELMTYKNRSLKEVFLSSKSFEEFAGRAPKDELPESLYLILRQASLFWKVMNGAHILYNIMIFESYGQGALNKFIPIWGQWVKEIHKGQNEIKEVLLADHLWRLGKQTNHTADKHTKRFIAKWIEAAKSPHTLDHQNEELQKLVINQEIHKKGGRSRLLTKKDSKLMQEYEGERIGFDDLNYRFGTIKMIVDDIHKGLGAIN